MANKVEPFVGPRPFERQDEKYFFGRDHVASELTSLIMASPVVILYAQSGAGKTSLLKAKVLSVLEDKKDFDVLPVARVRSKDEAGDEVNETSNIYIANALRDFSENELTPERRTRLNLAEYLAARPRPTRSSEEFETEDGEEERVRAVPNRPRVIIFDQFEELFTFYPERYGDRRDFFEQVRVALQQDSLLRVVFSMREDYIAELDPYVHTLPDSMRTRFRMERLRTEAALQAIVGPLRRYNEEVTAGQESREEDVLTFDNGVAEKLVDTLRTIKVHDERGEVEFKGEFIEPVHLQIVCKALCEKMLTEGHSRITLQDLETFGNVNQALVDYFERAVAKAARETGVAEGDLRRWFDRVLITPDNTRSTVLRGREQTAGVPNKAIDIFEDQRLIRAEARDNRLWYELSHDKLIEPLRDSYQQWQLRQPGDERIRLRLITRAERWLASRRKDNDLLLNESELAIATPWANSDSKGVGYDQSLAALVEASQAALDRLAGERERDLALERQRLAEAEAEVQKEKAAAAEREALHAQTLADERLRATGRARRLSVGLAVMFLLASLSTVFAFRQNTELKFQRGVAETERKKAEDQALLATNQRAEADRLRELAQEQKTEAETQRGVAVTQAALAREAEVKAATAASAEKRERLKAVLASREAARQRTLASSSTAAAQSELMIAMQPNQLESSVKRALASLTLDNSSMEGAQALRHGLALLPQLVKKIDFNSSSAAFTPDGSISVLNSSQFALYDKDGNLKKESEGFDQEGVVSIHSPDGRFMGLVGKHIVNVTNITNPGDTIAPICYAKDKEEDECGSGDDDLDNPTFSPDGRYLAGIAVGKPRVWEVRTGRRLLDLPKAYYLLDDALLDRPVTFSRDGNFIAVQGARDVSVYKIEGGKLLFTTPQLEWGADLAFSLSDRAKYLATGAKAKVQVWDVDAKEEKAHWLQQREVSGIVFSSDGSQLATVTGNTVTVWNSVTGQEITRVGHTVPVNKVLFSPTANLLATTSDDRTTRIWDARSGRELFRLGHDTVVRSLSFSQDERYLVTGSDDVRLWAISRSGESLAVYEEGSVEQTVFSPDGNYVAVSYSQPTTGAMPTRPIDVPMGFKILNPHTGLIVANLPLTLRLPKAVFSLDSKYLFLMGIGKKVRVWETSSGKLEKEYELEEPSEDFAFSADGRYLVAAAFRKGKTEFMDLSTGQSRMLRYPKVVTTVSINRDGSKVLTVGDAMGASEIIIWDTATMKHGRPFEITSVTAAKLSPDGLYFAYTAGRGLWILYDITVRAPALVGIDKTIRAVTFSDDGQLVAFSTRLVGEGSRLELYRVPSWESIAVLVPEATSSFRAFSQDGTFFASGGGGLAQVWSLPGLTESVRIEHNGRVRSIAFSPNDKYIATGSSDQSLRFTLLQLADLIGVACQRTSSLTKKEWQNFFAGEPYRPICPR